MGTYNPDKSFDDFSDEILKRLQEMKTDEDGSIAFSIKSIATKATLGVLRKYHQTYYQNQSQD